MGSADFSVPIFLELVKKFDVQAVITEIDKPAGRGKEIVSPPTKKLAIQNNIPCWQPLGISKNPSIYEKVKSLDPDLIVVAAYGKILPKDFLNLPKHGCLNVHPSLLPKYRGASPIQAALINGDKATGVSIILMDPKMDAGDIVEQEVMDIESDMDYGRLSRKLSFLSAEMLTKIIPLFIDGQLTLSTQNDSEATYCNKVNKSDGRIDWKESVETIYNQLRAYSAWPGSFTTYNRSKLDIIDAVISELNCENKKPGDICEVNKKILVKCAQGFLELRKVKLEGKKETEILDFVNGHQAFVGSTLE